MLNRLACVVAVAGSIGLGLCALSGVVIAIMLVWADGKEQTQYYMNWMMTNCIIGVSFSPTIMAYCYWEKKKE